jgi:hypothetical protein
MTTFISTIFLIIRIFALNSLLFLAAYLVLNTQNNQLFPSHSAIAHSAINQNLSTTHWTEIRQAFSHIQNNDICLLIPSSIANQIEIITPPSTFNATNNISKEFHFTRHLLPGGHYTPLHCQARHRVLIIVPYKDRLHNLNFFLYHMHPLLQRQELEYRILVVEQANDALFNKGVLMNGAFIEMLGLKGNVSDLVLENGRDKSNKSNQVFKFDCVVFHDVDLLPEDDRFDFFFIFFLVKK